MNNPTKEELLESIPQIYKDEEGFDTEVEVALYWFATHYHSGKFSHLYSILSTSEYTPGHGQMSIEGEGFLAEEIYHHFVERFGK